MKEAGDANGMTFKVIQTQNAATLGPAQIMQAQLKKAGIIMDMDVVEHATYHQQIRKDLSDLVIYASSRFLARIDDIKIRRRHATLDQAADKRRRHVAATNKRNFHSEFRSMVNRYCKSAPAPLLEPALSLIRVGFETKSDIA